MYCKYTKAPKHVCIKPSKPKRRQPVRWRVEFYNLYSDVSSRAFRAEQGSVHQTAHAAQHSPGTDYLPEDCLQGVACNDVTSSTLTG